MVPRPLAWDWEVGDGAIDGDVREGDGGMESILELAVSVRAGM